MKSQKSKGKEDKYSKTGGSMPRSMPTRVPLKCRSCSLVFGCDEGGKENRCEFLDEYGAMQKCDKFKKPCIPNEIGGPSWLSICPVCLAEMMPKKGSFSVDNKFASQQRMAS